MPNHSCDFEIPDDWLVNAGMLGLDEVFGATLSEGAIANMLARAEAPTLRHLQKGGRLLSIPLGLKALCCRSFRHRHRYGPRYAVRRA